MADTIKAKVKTATMQMEINGGLDDAIGEIFIMVKTTARRDAVIAKLNELNDRMTSFENERAAATA